MADGAASGGFTVMYSFASEGVDDVVPELQRRGIFREGYTGTSLSEHLGLPRPPNRFFA